MAETYYVLQCPHCGVWQAKIIRKILAATLSCVKCMKSTKVKQSGKYGLSIKCALVTDCGALAASKVADMNMKVATNAN